MYAYLCLPAVEFTPYGIGRSITDDRDFKIYDKQYNDVTDSILNTNKTTYIIVATREFTPRNRRRTIKFHNSHIMQKSNRIVVTNGDMETENSATCDGLMCTDNFIADGLLLKTLLRTQGGVVAISDGKIVGKYKINSYFLYPFESGATCLALEIAKICLLIGSIVAALVYILRLKRRYS